MLAHVLEDEVELAGHILLDPCRDADAAGVGQRFEPGGNVDAIADNVAVVADRDLTDVDADPIFDPFRQGKTVVVRRHLPLHLARTAERVDDAGEFDQQTVPGDPDEPAMIGRNRRVHHLGPD